MAAPALETAVCDNAGFCMFETTKETAVLDVRVPREKVTIRTGPRNSAVAAGVSLIPVYSETCMVWPSEGEVNPLSVIAKRLKLPMLEGVKKKGMSQEAPAIVLPITTRTFCKVSTIAGTIARAVQSSNVESEKVAAPTALLPACAEDGF